jgi:hypothetical protein
VQKNERAATSVFEPAAHLPGRAVHDADGSARAGRHDALRDRWGNSAALLFPAFVLVLSAGARAVWQPALAHALVWMGDRSGGGEGSG